MPITDVHRDLDALSLTVTGEYPVEVRRLWDAYADPRQIERFWGPVGWPATFTRHDMFPGGTSDYVMHGPDGQRAGGFWEFVEVDAPSSFEVMDGFAREDGTPDPQMPTMHMAFRFDATEAGSRLTATTWFSTREQFEQLLEMGMEDGMRSAMGQIDDVVADESSFQHTGPAQVQLLSDTQVRVSRVVRGLVDVVWRAHQQPRLLRTWMLGPDGWTMPVCQVPERVGGSYRLEWEPVPGGAAQPGERFGFTGEVVEVRPWHRMVTTERMLGSDGPGTLNELTLTTVEGGTLIVTVITYPSREVRDAVLETGMVDGMEASYRRLESEVLEG